MLWNNYIAAVNGALRHVAAREALPVIDYEDIMLQLPTAYVHSGDGFHPQARTCPTCFLDHCFGCLTFCGAQSRVGGLGWVTHSMVRPCEWGDTCRQTCLRL